MRDPGVCTVPIVTAIIPYWSKMTGPLENFGVHSMTLLIIYMVIAMATDEGSALRCYECYSTKNPDCGEYFYPDSFEPMTCKEEETLCALQRQEEIPGEQVQAIVRGCYKPGLLEGLNSTAGCRSWMNPSDKYAALYCFCDTDLCNSAQRAPTWPPSACLILIFSALLQMVAPLRRLFFGNIRL